MDAAETNLKFDLPKDHSSIIKVIGVGGGGGNAVNYMFEQGIKDVDFIVCNTDAQVLEASPVPIKIQLGATLTEGKGAGSIPEVGKNAAVENLDDVKAILEDKTTMVFITAGMGGGTGTGAAPVIARAAREMGILTVGIVTVPFMFEGRKRKTLADQGLKEMREAVDTLLIITNEKLRELYGNLTLRDAFSHADEVLCTAAKGIAEVITLTGDVNVDMNDVNTVMRDSGVAIMGSFRAQGENRALRAVEGALASPLLNDNDITGAKYVLLNITHGNNDILMDEITEITDHIQEQAGMSAEVIWGYGLDERLGEDICVTVIATGFQSHEIDAGMPVQKPAVKRFELGAEVKNEITKPVSFPTQQDKPANKIVMETEAIPEPFLKTPAPAQEVTIQPAQEEEVRFRLDEEPLAKEEVSLPAPELDLSQPMLFDTPTEMVQEEVKAEELPQQEAEPTFDPFGKIDTTPTPPPEEVEESENVVTYDLDQDELPNQSEELEISALKNTIKFIDHNAPVAGAPNDRPSRIELKQINEERTAHVREVTQKLRLPSGLSDLENKPAYIRRNVQLDVVPHSTDSNVSQYTLGENSEGDVQIKPNNPYLHDQVD